MSDDLASVPVVSPAHREEGDNVSKEELRALLERAVPGAEALDRQLKAVFELSDENSSIRLRG
jgi:hypothetical protein